MTISPSSIRELQERLAKIDGELAELAACAEELHDSIESPHRHDNRLRHMAFYAQVARQKLALAGGQP